ncbi:MAG: sulfur carrier protein ThiS adenylyltransferase ThiF, partial [Kiritimatiellaceae bacterium]
MKIGLNERELEVAEGLRLRALVAAQRPEADVWIVNGAAVSEDVVLQAGDEVMLIERGAVPAAAELEAVMAARHTPGVHAKMKGACVGIAG